MAGRGPGRMASKMIRAVSAKLRAWTLPHRQRGSPQTPGMPENQGRKAYFWAGTAAYSWYILLQAMVHVGLLAGQVEGGRFCGTGGLAAGSCPAQHREMVHAIPRIDVPWGPPAQRPSQCWSGLCPMAPVPLFWEALL